MTNADIWQDIHEALEELRYRLLALPECPESSLAASYFGPRATTELKCLRSALRRREKERP